MQVSSLLYGRLSACIMLLARSWLDGNMLFCADSMPSWADPMLFGRYTAPSGSMPLLTDITPLLADSIPL